MIRLTLIELRRAADWAEKHAKVAHGGDLTCADIAIREVGNCGIGPSHEVSCEACSRANNRDTNYLDITDYGAW